MVFNLVLGNHKNSIKDKIRCNADMNSVCLNVCLVAHNCLLSGQ